MSEMFKIRSIESAKNRKPKEGIRDNRTAEIHTFTGLNFTEIRRTMEKYGFSTKGLPGYQD